MKWFALFVKNFSKELHASDVGEKRTVCVFRGKGD